MKKNCCKTGSQLDLFTNAGRLTTYFELSQNMKKRSWNLDVLTPMFQERMNKLSPREKDALVACIELNRDRPVSSPISAPDLKQEMLSGKNRLNMPYNFILANKTDPRGVSQALTKLKDLNILHIAKDDEFPDTSTSKRHNIYVIANAGFETWYRYRTEPDQQTAQKMSPDVAREWAPSEI